jgi:prepilin-type processing-associated H-X9-DG protein
MSITTTGDLRIKMVLISSLTLVAVLCVVCAEKYTMLKLNVAFADGQVAIFEDMKASANGTTDPQQLSGKLEYVMNYYPSGSKQKSGTQLDRIVELARSNSIAVIIGRLRIVTGKDLGNDPKDWVGQYPPSQ